MAESKFKGMRNREAARYARWSAGIAVAICLAVIGVYVQRRMHGRISEESVHPVPPAVAQQSDGFTISRAIGKRTIFTVHASQATEFKDQNRSLLENVDITIYGPRGDRNDSVHAGECSYEPKSGSIRCHGVVEIDLRNSKRTTNAERAALHLETSNILFDHNSGRVSTENSVALKFPGGDGTGTGLVYEPQTENATLEKNVQLDIQPSSNPKAPPVRLSGSALGFRRSENVVEIAGPVRIQQDGRTLTAGVLDLQLDSAMQPSRAVATRNPELVANGPQGNASLSADRIAGDFSPAGLLERLSADENVRADVEAGGGEDQVSAQHAQVELNPGKRQAAREILAQGNVRVQMDRAQSRGSLATESLRVELSSNENGRGYRIVSAESLAPAKMTLNKTNEADEIDGTSLTVIFGARNEITELRGASGVRLARARDGDPTEISTAAGLMAKFDPDGNWRTIDEKGDVTLQRGLRRASANSATMIRTSREITLRGAASVDDPSSRLQADEIRIDQASDEFHARGNVAASFIEGGGKIQGNPQTSVLHISADKMDGIASSKAASTGLHEGNGHFIFLGHARMWQASNVLQAQTIEFWQSEKRVQARGDVLGEFVEAPHKEHQIELANAKSAKKDIAPVVWQVRASRADYWGDAGKVDLTGGVDARSSEATMQSPNIQLFFSRAQNNSQQLERAIATGGVRVEQNVRTGTAERGEYIASEGKFVLSGGHPTLADSSGNTTTGRELTFFLASDTIQIDSQSEPRTIIKHRAEK